LRPATNIGSEPDRLYIELTVENSGEVPRHLARGELSLRARDGTAWTPLADDFPGILIEPQGRLTTRFIFEVPPDASWVELTWKAAEGPRIPIADDALGTLLGGVCRVSSSDWQRRPTAPTGKPAQSLLLVEEGAVLQTP